MIEFIRATRPRVARQVIVITLTIIVVAILVVGGHSPHGRYLLMLARSYHNRTPIVVLESDDWGKELMPDSNTRAMLTEHLSPRPLTPTSRLARETAEDLKQLFAVLEKHHDVTGRPAVFTANLVVSNPDFAKIRQSGFTHYYRIPFAHGQPPEYMDTWKEGIKKRLVFPQYHGLDHLVPEAMLVAIRMNDPIARLLFDHGVPLSPFQVIGEGPDYRAEYVDLSVKPSRSLTYERQIASLQMGLAIFEETFGFQSISAIPPYYYFDDNTLKAYANSGVRYVQGACRMNSGTDANGSAIFTPPLPLGTRSADGLILLSRTAGAFEPSRGRECVQEQKRLITRCFRMHIPAIIITHSFNYCGRVEPQMAQDARRKLDELLTWIENEYPDVRYLTSPELGQLIAEGYYTDVFTGERVDLSATAEPLVIWAFTTGIVPAGCGLGLLGYLAFATVRYRRRHTIKL